MPCFVMWRVDETLLLVSTSCGIIAASAEHSDIRALLVFFVPPTVRQHQSIALRAPCIGARVYWIRVAEEAQAGTSREMSANERGMTHTVFSTRN